MADKTITIDMKAQGKERSTKGKTGRNLLDVLAQFRLSEAAIDALEEQVSRRQAGISGIHRPEGRI